MKLVINPRNIQILTRAQLARATIDVDHPLLLANTDSRDLIRRIPSQSIDFLLTDPPYNLNGYSTGNMKLNWRKDINNDVADWDGEDFRPKEWVEEVVRVLKPTGNFFAFTSYNMLGKWHEAFDPIFDTFQFMVWHKTNPVPKLRRAGFLNSCELIICAWNKGHTWNFSTQKEMHNFIETPICMGRERVKKPHHPTQKPLRVLRHLIQLASKPGDVVFDPFMGVGSTGIAARELGRRFVGSEIDKGYFEAAVDRLVAAESQLVLPLSFERRRQPETARSDGVQQLANRQSSCGNFSGGIDRPARLSEYEPGEPPGSPQLAVDP